MTEPDVTLTDYGLFVECAVFAWLIARYPARSADLRAWVVLFFACTAVAALLGGTVHGFFLDADEGVGRHLWRLSLLAIGAAALGAWAIGARLLLSRARAGWVVRAAVGAWGFYAAVVFLVSDAFAVAIAGYLPAAVFLFAGFVRAARRSHTTWAHLGAWGIALSFVAAAIQQLRLAVHPLYFNHNALYHVVQAVALALVFVASRGLLTSTGGFDADTA